MTYETLIYEQIDRVARVTLNRPQAYNAMSRGMLQELDRVIDRVERDDTVRAVLFTGAGRAFCAGADISASNRALPGADYEALRELAEPERDAQLHQLGSQIRQDLIDNHHRIAMRLQSLQKPTICALNGQAAGGGIGLALSMDIVIAARSAKLTAVFVPKLALAPDVGVSWHLTRALGSTRAMAMILLGEPLSAEDAERYGLVWKVVDDVQLAEFSLQTAARIASNAATANALAKRAVQQAHHNTLEQQLQLEADSQGLCAAQLDFIEGVLAFQQKRTPKFS